MQLHGHIPVLLKQTLAILAPKPGDVVVDCTVGRGGHSMALAEHIGPKGQIVGFDLDRSNLQYTEERVRAADGRFKAIHGSFVAAAREIQNLGLQADIVLADLGFSSNQMDDPSRGFSFSSDAPLDMRLNPAATLSAADLLAVLGEKELADLIYEFGEDPLARKIARKIVQNRQPEPILTTARLAGLVVEAYGPKARFSRMHPATRTFMALRIAVNDELGALRGLLDNIVQGASKVTSGGWLKSGARMAVISFHSLEDRLVKQCFADLVERGLATALTKKPIGPDDDELRANPRSRSAKLRAVRIDGPNARAPVDE